MFDTFQDRRTFLKVTGLGTLFSMVSSSCGLPQASVKSSKGLPNFLVFLADDLSAQELGCYGNTVHKTPFLDNLAETGVKFETCYSSPYCYPTRVMLMTGQYGVHSGVYNFPTKRGGPDPDAPESNIANHTTFAHVLKSRGYATAVAGKWQISNNQPNSIYESGFDEYCMHDVNEDLLKEEDVLKHKEKDKYWNPGIIKNRELMDTKEDDYCSDILAEFVIDFIKRKKDQPFFMYYPMILVHAPRYPTPDTIQPGQDRNDGGKENFKGMVEYMDKIVGRIVRALDEMGVRDNTIIFFTGDNGSSGVGKRQPTELGARVPMIVNCPGIVKPRGTTMELTDLSDVMPTLAGFAGAMLPTDRPIDGESYAAFLRGKTDTTRDWIFSFVADRRIIRTKRWLLEDNSPHHYGHLFDCGSSRDGTGYKEVTNSTDPEVIKVKKKFDKILAKLPAPYIPHEGPTNERKDEKGKSKNKGDREDE